MNMDLKKLSNGQSPMARRWVDEAHPRWMAETLSDDPHPECPSRRHYRSIWISDVHLGTKGSKADLLCDFLKYNDCDNLYLVGDIIDGWQMKKRAYWPQAHVNVIRRVLTRLAM